MHCKTKTKKKTKSVKSYGMHKKKPVKSYGMHKKKKAPKGYHYMPDGTLMKDSEHKKKKKPVRSYSMHKKKKLTGGRKKLDANKDGKISGADFKLLRGRKKK